MQSELFGIERQESMYSIIGTDEVQKRLILYVLLIYLRRSLFRIVFNNSFDVALYSVFK